MVSGLRCFGEDAVGIYRENVYLVVLKYNLSMEK